MSQTHLHEELARSKATVTAETQYGVINGRRAANGAAVFLGTFATYSSRPMFRISDVCRISEVPYALPPTRFADPVPLPPDFRYETKEYILESKCTFHSHLLVPHLSSLTLILIACRSCAFRYDAGTQFADAVQPKNDGQARGLSPGTPEVVRIS